MEWDFISFAPATSSSSDQSANLACTRAGGDLGWQIGGQLEREDVPRDLGCVSFITINISCVAVAAADHSVARLIVRGKTDSFMGG